MSNTLLTETIGDLPGAVDPQVDDTFAVWQPDQNPHTRQMSLQQIQDTIGGLVDDAPRDGNVWGRVNASWVQVLPLSGGMVSPGPLGVQSTSTDAVFSLASPTGNANVLAGYQDGILSWQLSMPDTSAGDNFTVSRFNGAGINQDAGGYTFEIEHTTGQLVLPNGFRVTGGTATVTAPPVDAADVANKAYVDAKTALPPAHPTGPAGGSLDGTYPNPSIAGSGVVPGTYTYATVTIGFDGRITSADSGVVGLPSTPSGPAGGSLAGSYPNPTLALTPVAAGTYTNTNMTVGSDGRITAAASGSTAPTGAAGGDLTGSYPSPVLKATTVTAGSYTNTAITVDAKGRVTAAANGPALAMGSPTGPAGGSLAGTYPNPVIANSGVIAGTYTNANITVTTDGRVAAAASGKGGGGGGGTVTNIATAGAGITGGPIVISGTLSVQWNAGPVTTIGTGLGLVGGILSSLGAPPTGPAGGDLTGNYPNPTLRFTGVPAGSYGDSTHVAAFSIDLTGRVTSVNSVLITGAAPTGVAGGDLTGNFPNPVVSKVNTTPLGVMTATSGNILIMDGTTLQSKTMSGDGTINSGGGLIVTKTNGLTFAASATTDTTNATNITSGALPAARLPGTTVTAGSYGDSTHVGTFTVDATGRLVAAASVTITGAAPSGAAGGDLSGTFPNPSVIKTGGVSFAPSATVDTTNAANISTGILPAARLPNTTVTPGSYTSTNLTVAADGRITAASNGTGGTLGTVTKVSTTGAGITGGPITTAGTLSVQWNAGAVAALDSATLLLTSGTLSAVTGVGGPPTGAAGGDLSSTYPNPTVSKINGTPLGAMTATAGRILVMDGTNAQSRAMSGDATLASTGVITVTKTSGVAFSKSATTDATNASNITTGTLPAAQLPVTTVTAGSYTNTNLTVGSDGRITAAASGTSSGGAGTVTNIATSGTGISGGPITSTGTLSVAWNAGTVSSLSGATVAGGVMTVAPAFTAVTGVATYAQLPTEVQQLPISFPFAGQPPAAGVVNVPMAFAVTVAAALAGTVVYYTTQPTSSAVFTVNKISGLTTTALGTVTVSTSGTSHTNAALAGAGGSLAIGDVLQIVAPTVQDAALSDVGISVLCARV